MKIIRLVLLSLAAALGALTASAQQAQVVAVNGSATVQKPGTRQAVPITLGETLPEGTQLTTGNGSTVVIRSHEGIETGVGANSSIAVGTHGVSSDGIRTAVIDLKNGTTVSVLDPSKKAVNNYAVRTPKGVAAARGTTYSTTVTLTGGGEAVVTVNTLTGSVSFSIVGGPTVAVNAGNSASSSTGSSTSIAAALNAATPEQKAQITEALRVAVTVTAVVAQVSQTTGDTGAPATLQSVVAAVTSAANEIAATDAALANTLVSDTVTAVRTYAGANAAEAVATVQSTATNPAVAAAAETASTAPVAPVTVPAAPPASPSTPPAPIIVPPAPTAPTPDITIDVEVVSPSS